MSATVLSPRQAPDSGRYRTVLATAVLFLALAVLPAWGGDAALDGPAAGASGPATALSLGQVLAMVREQNPMLAAEQASWQAKRQEVVTATAVFEPEFFTTLEHKDASQRNTVSERVSRQFLEEFQERNTEYKVGVETFTKSGATVTAAYTYRRLSDSLTSIYTNHDHEYQVETGVTVTQPLLRGRGAAVTTAGVRNSEAEAAAGFQEVRSELLRLAGEAADAYWDLYLAQEILANREQAVNFAHNLLQDERARFQRGKIPVTEILETRAGLLERQSLAAEARQNLVRSRNHLQILLGIPAQAAQPPLVAADHPRTTPVEEDFETLVAAALEHHPEYQRWRQRMAAAKIKVAYAANQRWPQLDLKASYGLNGLDFNGRTALDQVGDASYDAWSVGLQFRLPLFGGRKSASELAKANLEKRRALLRLKAVEVEVANAIHAALEACRTSHQRLALTEEALEVKRRLMDIEAQRLEAGKSTSRLLLGRQDDYRLAREDRLRQVVAYQQARVRLLAVQGTLLGQYGVDITEPPPSSP